MRHAITLLFCSSPRFPHLRRFSRGAMRRDSSWSPTGRATTAARWSPTRCRAAPACDRPGPSRGTSRSAAFDDYIEVHAASQGVSPELVRAVIQVESAFNPQAVSPKGAMGLMQLMPATARDLGVDNPFAPEDNIRGGVAYLRQLLDRYDSNVELALAAYNAGPGSVAKYGTVPPYRETQDYVKKVTDKSGPVAPPPPDPTIYKWIDLVDGKAIVRYGNKPPQGVDAVPVTKR